MIIERDSRLSANATTRRLHRAHFAFMRALIQGMDERTAWMRFLQEEGEPTDLRRLRATVLRIKDTFAAAARREKRPGTARLIRLDPERIPERVAPKIPSLEEFALSQGLEDFSEDEQLEAYLVAFPVASAGGGGRANGRGAGSRREKMVARQLEALRWLEDLVVHDPKPLDSVQAWLSPTLAAHLRACAIYTLQDLADILNTQGPRWWRKVPGIGHHKATRLVEWLQTHAPLLDLTIESYALMPRRHLSVAARSQVVAPATALRPLEKFVPAVATDGRQGRFRNLTSSGASLADTDLHAIQAWIASKGDLSPNRPLVAALNATQRSYRKEAERLLLWATLVHGKALSDLEAEDLVLYVSFLQAPPPAWCGTRAQPRWSPQWRPLEGPLSVSALRQAKVIVHGMFAFLEGAAYLRHNPAQALVSRRSRKPSRHARRDRELGVETFREQLSGSVMNERSLDSDSLSVEPFNTRRGQTLSGDDPSLAR